MASVDYVVTDNWGAGFVASMAVGGGNEALHGWTVEFDAAFGISSIWGAVILSHVGTHYVIGNLPWNSDVAPGASTAFGFQATPGATGTTTQPDRARDSVEVLTTARTRGAICVVPGTCFPLE